MEDKLTLVRTAAVIVRGDATACGIAAALVLLIRADLITGVS